MQLLKRIATDNSAGENFYIKPEKIRLQLCKDMCGHRKTWKEVYKNWEDDMGIIFILYFTNFR